MRSLMQMPWILGEGGGILEANVGEVEINKIYC